MPEGEKLEWLVSAKGEEALCWVASLGPFDAAKATGWTIRRGGPNGRNWVLRLRGTVRSIGFKTDLKAEAERELEKELERKDANDG